jgi:DNA-binding HxlR family transcriptional regulator
LSLGLQVNHEECRALASILSRIGDKWTVFVVGLLAERTMRFTELRRAIAGISQRMLTLTLRGLEGDGLVSRTVYPTIPPRVDYALTELGRTLIDPLIVLGDWARENQAAVEAARRRYGSARSDKGLARADKSDDAAASGAVAEAPRSAAAASRRSA